MANAGKLGFRVLPSPPRIGDEILARFRGLASSNLADAMGRFNFMDPGIQLRSGVPLCGQWESVRSVPPVAEPSTITFGSERSSS